MKRVTFRFMGGTTMSVNLPDENASALFGDLGRAWNERTGVMYTFMLGTKTHMVNLTQVSSVDVE
jgi:hypothetical protein